MSNWCLGGTFRSREERSEHNIFMIWGSSTVLYLYCACFYTNFNMLSKLALSKFHTVLYICCCCFLFELLIKSIAKKRKNIRRVNLDENFPCFLAPTYLLVTLDMTVNLSFKDCSVTSVTILATAYNLQIIFDVFNKFSLMPWAQNNLWALKCSCFWVGHVSPSLCVIRTGPSFGVLAALALVFMCKLCHI